MDHMPRGMTPVIVVMIFRVKIRKDLANDVLSGMFHEDQRQIEEIFELACTYQFMFGCDIPRLWTSDPDEASKNKAYAAINASLDPYHDEIRKAMPVSLSIISLFSLGWNQYFDLDGPAVIWQDLCVHFCNINADQLLLFILFIFASRILMVVRSASVAWCW